jgi:hypothetical protein
MYILFLIIFFTWKLQNNNQLQIATVKYNVLSTALIKRSGYFHNRNSHFWFNSTYFLKTPLVIIALRCSFVTLEY